MEWAKRCEGLGAGEILLTSIDREGTRKGFDIDLVKTIASAVAIPVIASGGMGTVADLVKVVMQGKADAVAMSDILHYNRRMISEIRQDASIAGVKVTPR